MRPSALLLVLALAVAGPAAASDPAALAREASERLQEATAALAEAGRARDRVAAMGEVIRAYEGGLVAMREGLRRAALRERAIAMEFESRRDRLARLTATLQTIERAPRPILLMHPSGALGSARAGMMLAELMPALQAEAGALARDLEEIALLRAIIERGSEELALGLRGVQEARVALSEALAERTEQPLPLTDDPAALQRLLEGAETLDVFAEGLVSLQGEAEGEGGFAAARGGLPWPVAGTLLRGWQEADAAGIRRPGWVVATPPLSLVTAPATGTLRYAGPLLDYGNVIILEPDANYLLVMAGIDRIFGTEGQLVTAGDPLGLMGGAAPGPGEFLIEGVQGAGARRQETLYIETREADGPVDPGRWFAPDGG
ncbi:MAG: peptidoglycan DD-metalloendopeptidase family protein [Rhodobacteraceae bacterium]|nr:peptidoglycan DD-metalloendopeptidase family protein [Paracoccaceae bacterium]